MSIVPMRSSRSISAAICIVTNMSAKPEGVVHFYHGRGTAEQWIKEGNYALHWTRLSGKRFVCNQVRLGLFVLAYNLGNCLRRLVLPRKIKHESLRSLLVKLINIGAKVVRHNRYTTFQMARCRRINPQQPVRRRVPLEFHLAVLIQVAQIRLHAGVEDRVDLLPLGPSEVALDEVVDLLRGIDLGAVQVRLQVVQLVGIGLVRQDRCAIVVGEGVADGIRVVEKVEHEHVVLLGMRSVEARQGLHGLDARQRLVDVHRVQQRLVVPGLELVGAHQETVGILPKLLGDSGGGEAVQGTLADLLPTELVLTGEGDDGSVPAFPLLQVVPDGVEVLDRALDSVGDHHRPGFPADLALCPAPDRGSGRP